MKNSQHKEDLLHSIAFYSHVVVTLITQDGESVLPHLMDRDDNPMQHLKNLLIEYGVSLENTPYEFLLKREKIKRGGYTSIEDLINNTKIMENPQDEEIVTVIRIKDKTYEICKDNCLKILQIGEQNCYEVHYDGSVVRFYNVDEVYSSSIEKVRNEYEEWIKEIEDAIENPGHAPVPVGTSEAIMKEIKRIVRRDEETRSEILEERKKEYKLFKKIYIDKK